MIGVFDTDNVTIKRPGALTDSGLEGTPTTLHSDVRCRLEVVQHHKYDSSDEYEDNRTDALLFLSKDFGIQKRDIVEHSGGENYTVKRVGIMKTLHKKNHFEVELVSR